MICLRRSTALALVLFTLFASASFAAPRPIRPADSTQGVVASLWDWFTSSLSLFANPQPTFSEKAGSHMDPDGLSFTGNGDTTPTTDAGSQMDPNG